MSYGKNPAQRLLHAPGAIPTRLVDGAVKQLETLQAVPLIAFTAMGIDPGQLMYVSEDALREQARAKMTMFDSMAASFTDGENRVLDNASHSWIHIEAEDAVTRGILDMVAKVRG